VVELGTLRMALVNDPAKADEHVQNACSVADGMLDDIHRLIADLRPSLLDDLGLVAAIHSLGAKRLTPQGIDLQLQEEGLPERLPAIMETVLFRITQEAITNVIRYAQASIVQVRLSQQAGLLRLEIEDNGLGFDPSSDYPDSNQEGFGLRGMRERVRILGGQFHLQAAPGQGTLISVLVPMLEGKTSG
jgi:two-component system, NarL family, sensor histidine kinase UhpB